MLEVRFKSNIYLKIFIIVSKEKKGRTDRMVVFFVW